MLRDLKELYVDVYNLSNFSELNETGFRKILKKHDKVTERPVKDQFMPLISRQLGPRREALLPVLSSIPEMYAELDPRNHGGPAEAEILLKRDVQEQVTFERQAVWKDRMEEERRSGGLANTPLPRPS